jgi:hypothetical protein
LELYQQVDDLDASSTDADADDEETDDLRQESEDENRADGQGKICHGDDRRKKLRDTRGRSPADEAEFEYSAVDGIRRLRSIIWRSNGGSYSALVPVPDHLRCDGSAGRRRRRPQL